MTTHVGFRSVHSDFSSSRGFRWPYPGQVATAPGPILNHDGACPIAVGDGICIAKTWRGAASGGISANTCLVIEYDSQNVLGEDQEKVRVSECMVVEVLDVPLLARSGYLTYANLRSADLRSADLTYANLRSADLTYANLTYANLRSANLRSADLTYANLRSANLRSADLRSANLRSADLRSADLTYANLRSADLTYANLRSADLTYANLRSANLRSADLTYANLTYANNVVLPSKWKMLDSGIVVLAN